jgi:hypothetical protein
MAAGGPTNIQNYMNSNQKNILASETRKKTQENTHRAQENDFFLKCALMRFHTTHHIYKFAVRKKVFEKIFFLEISQVQSLLMKRLMELSSLS